MEGLYWHGIGPLGTVAFRNTSPVFDHVRKGTEYIRTYFLLSMTELTQSPHTRKEQDRKRAQHLDENEGFERLLFSAFEAS